MATRGIHRTPPIAADGADRAHAEVFTLVCRRDLYLAAIALKSLLIHREETRLAVTAIDDGTLTPAHRQWLLYHVPNLRWQFNRSAEMLERRELRESPRTRALYQDRAFPLMAKIIHPLLSCRTARVILLDTDTAFFRPPTRLLDFSTGRTDAPLYMHDHQNELQVIPEETQPLFQTLVRLLNLPDARFRLQHWLFNSGLLAFKPADFDLNIAERYLAWLDATDPRAKAGKMAIWFGPWTREQTIFMLMFASGPVEAQPLGDDYWLGGAKGHVFNHFLRHYLVRKSCLDMLGGIIRRLCDEPQ